MGNKTDTLNKLLAQFAKNYIHFSAQIDDAIEQTDQETSVRLAHTLKGLAANLGIEDIALTAGILETKLRSDESDLDTIRIMLNQLSAQITKTCDLIEHNLPAVQIEHDLKNDLGLNIADLAGELDMLLIFLESDDRRALEQFQKLQNHLREQYGDKLISQLDQYLDLYDFSAAAELLHSIMSE